MQPFSPWLPDIASFESLASTTARNVIPSSYGFKPFPAFVAESTPLTAKAQGAASFRRVTSPQTFNMCGDVSKLYRMAAGGGSWSNVSRLVGGAYATASDGFWSFAQFGDFIVAANQADDTQLFNMNGGANFTLLGGSPPKAKFTGVVRDFVVLAGVANFGNRLQWSAINNVADWVPSVATMSDIQELAEGGNITGFVGGDVGVVFCEKAVYRMAFEGPPVIFRFDRISDSLGCRAPRSIASYDNLIFFLTDDGPYMVRGATEMVSIGPEKVDNWFRQNMSTDQMHQVTGAIDPINKIYVMGFCSTGNNLPDKLAIYHWPTGQWAYADVPHEMIYSGAKQDGMTYDTAPGTIDGMVFSFDSFLYAGGSYLRLAGFNPAHQSGFFSGTSMVAEVETGDIQLSPGRKSLLRALRPMVIGNMDGLQIAIGFRDRLNDPVVYDLAVTSNGNGVCTFRRNARYHRARMIIPQNTNWTNCLGVDDVVFSPMGKR